jgi:predicted Zn-dependent peptidase
MLREILSEQDSPGSVCQIKFASMLYGKHSYARSMLGATETGVEASWPKELTQFYRRFIFPPREPRASQLLEHWTKTSGKKGK